MFYIFYFIWSYILNILDSVELVRFKSASYICVKSKLNHKILNLLDITHKA